MKCQGYTKKGKKCTRETKQKYCFQHKNGQRSDNFVMFNQEERKEILKHYYDIVKNEKPCVKYPIDKVLKASSGMYVYPKPIPEEKGKAALCQSIDKSYKEDNFPIVHEDSITAWGNRAAENYGLEIGDILKMKSGQKMNIILMNRNVSDYIVSQPGRKNIPK